MSESIASHYLTGYRIGFAYLCGLQDGGTPVTAQTYIRFPDVFGQHYKAQQESPVPNLLVPSLAYKQWQMMQTMSADNTDKNPDSPPCSADAFYSGEDKNKASGSVRWVSE